jgi:hypothetical protein
MLPPGETTPGATSMPSAGVAPAIQYSKVMLPLTAQK